MSDTEHDHNYLSTKGPGEPLRDPLSGMVGLFGSTEGPEDFADAVTDAVMTPSLPDDGDWPCQRDQMVYPPPRLASLLYVLIRDHVQPGDMEQIMLIIRHNDKVPLFTNGHLEGYVRSLCTYLLEDPPQ